MAVLRAIWSDRLTSLGTFALVAVLTGAAVVATDAAVSAAPVLLLLVGAIALLAHLTGAVRTRTHEVALARLRGTSGIRLLRAAVAAPAVVVGGGAAAGLVLGGTLAHALAHRWGTASPVAGWRSALVASCGVLAAVAVLVIASVRQRRRPLVEALAPGPQRITTPLAQRFGEVLVLVAAVLVARQARLTGGWWTPLAAALVAYAGAEVVGWLAGPALRWLPGSLSGYLTQRRVRRDHHALDALRGVVAAGVLVALALQATLAASAWRDTAARLAVGAPTAYPMVGALAAYEVADHADPSGRWAMPIVATTDDATDERRVFAGMDRWQRVIGDFLPRTLAASAAGIAAAAPPVFTVGRLAVSGADGPVDLAYASGAQNARLSAHGVVRDGRATVPVDGCAAGCLLLATTFRSSGRHTIRADGRALTDRTGAPLGGSEAPLQAVATAGQDVADVADLDGTDRAADVVGSADALPLVGTDGVLLDLGAALSGSGISAVDLASGVLLRSDAPAAVVRAVAAAASGPPTTFESSGVALGETAEARGDALTLVVAAAAGLIALLSLLIRGARLPAERRSEAAGLRAAGLGRGAVAASYRLEAVLLGSLAGIGTVAVGAVAAEALHGRLVLVGGWSPAPPPHTGAPWPILLAAAAVVAALTFVVHLAGLRGAVRAGTPASLREAGR